MSTISDPGRPSRRDRRRAQRLIDTAFAEQRLTAAERALRTQRIAAAHTRGDLAMITRDLMAPTTASLGQAIDPSTLSSMRVGDRSLTTPTLKSSLPTLPAGRTVDLSGVGRRVRLILIIAVVSLVGVCVLSLAALVPAMVRGVTGGSGSSSGPPTPVFPSGAVVLPTPGPVDGTPLADLPNSANPQTAAGWKAMVKAVKDASDTTSVYDAVIYAQYASIGLDGKGAVERRFYRDGAWDDSMSVRTPPVGSLVDLSLIDPEKISRLPAETAEHFKIEDPTGCYLIINAYDGNPQIMVYVQSDAAAQFRIYDLNGQPRG
ncbi:MAG: DUF1707 domain-containing protein [Aeromicrobium sp.]